MATHNTLAIVVICFVFTGCMGLSDKEQIAMDGYKHNSKSFYTTKDFPRAIDQCYKGLALDDDDYSLNLTLAWSMLRMGDKKHVFQAYEQFQKTDDTKWFNDDYRISLGLGETCFKIATIYRKGYDYYSWKISQSPESRELYEDQWEECKEGMEDYIEEAIEHLHDVLAKERQKDDVEAILTLGQAYAYSGQMELAIEYLTRGLNLLQNSTSFLQKRLDTDEAMTSEGKRFFKNQITENMIREKRLRSVLAFVHLDRNEYDLALEQYNILEDRDLFDPTQYYNRGLAYEGLKDYKKAISNFELFLRKATVDKEYEEDEHFHKAFEKMNKCKEKLAQQ